MNEQQPDFIRLPQEGQLCPFTSLSRSTLKRWIKEGKIDSAQFNDGKGPKLRLIFYPSLFNYIKSHMGPKKEAEMTHSDPLGPAQTHSDPNPPEISPEIPPEDDYVPF